MNPVSARLLFLDRNLLLHLFPYKHKYACTQHVFLFVFPFQNGCIDLIYFDFQLSVFFFPFCRRLFFRMPHITGDAKLRNGE